MFKKYAILNILLVLNAENIFAVIKPTSPDFCVTQHSKPEKPVYEKTDCDSRVAWYACMICCAMFPGMVELHEKSQCEKPNNLKKMH